MRFWSQKWAMWLLAGTILVSLTLLAAGIGSLELRPGIGLPGAEAGSLPAIGDSVLQFPSELLYTIIILLIIFLPVSLLMVLFSPAARRAFLQRAGQILLMLVTLILVSQVMGDQIVPDLTGGLIPQGDFNQKEAPEELETLALPPDQSPFWLGGALSLGLAALALWFGLRWWSGRQVEQDSAPTGALAEAAEAALQALRQGEGLQSVILRCYTQMLSVVSAARKLERAEYLTAREFEQSLIEAGLPAGEVDTLTRLFEFARYGQDSPTPLQEQQAIACLSALTAALAQPQTEAG